MNYLEFKKESLIKYYKLNEYKYLLENLNKTNIDKDYYYQRVFDILFPIKKNEYFRSLYFKYFDTIKDNKNISFNEILDYFYDKTGRVESSLSSKMLSIINTNYPVFDQYVMDYLSNIYTIKTRDKYSEKSKYETAIKVYDKVNELVNKEISKKRMISLINSFNKDFSEYELSNVKVLDIVMQVNKGGLK